MELKCTQTDLYISFKIVSVCYHETEMLYSVNFCKSSTTRKYVIFVIVVFMSDYDM